MKLSMIALTLLGALALSPVLSGCAAPDEGEDVGAQGAAVGSNPEYDAVVRDGTKVTTDKTRNARQSASTHLVGYVPRARAEAVLDRLLAVQRWTEIRDTEGTKAFSKAQLLSDDEAGGVRTITAKVTVDGGAKLDIRGTAKESGEKLVVSITNTNAYKHWLMGTILEANKMSMDIALVPYEGGVIVDATMRAKLAKMEDRAPELTGSIASIFDWLAE